MFFQKKVDRAMKWLKDKNGGEEDKKESMLEKHDFLAMILAALLVFGPILIILAIILILVSI